MIVSIEEALSGYWKYQLETSSMPQIDKYCALHETIGDKRLGDHILVGIESCLPFLIRQLQAECRLMK